MILAWLSLGLLQAQVAVPVLDFPEAGLDDTASYQGYQTRFYRDSEQNTVQIYLDPRSGRVVNLWADAANESLGFSVRDGQGRPVRLTWESDTAQLGYPDIAGDRPQPRGLEYRLQTDAPNVQLGWLVLGSMRIERDFQYAKRHLRSFADPPFRVAEESLLVAAIGRLSSAERARHLEILKASSLTALRQRLVPAIHPVPTGSRTALAVLRPSLDDRNTLGLEFRVDSSEATMQSVGGTVRIRSRTSKPVRFSVLIATDADPLTPLKREEIFNQAFLDFLASARSAKDSAGTDFNSDVFQVPDGLDAFFIGMGGADLGKETPRRFEIVIVALDPGLFQPLGHAGILDDSERGVGADFARVL